MNGRLWILRAACAALCVCTSLGAQSASAPLRLDLETAVRMGAANSFALKSLNFENAAVRSLITERWRAYLPNLTASLNRVRTITDNETDSLTNEVRLSIEQVLFDGGRRSLDLDLAKIDALLNRADFRITYSQLRLDVQQAYLRALSARGKILLNQKSLERARLQLRMTQREEQLGFSRRVDVYSVAARTREVELRVAQAENEYRQAIASLKGVLFLDYDAQLELEGDLLRDYFLKPPAVNVQDVILAGLARRPEVLRSMTEVRRRTREREIEENFWMPRVALNGYYSRTGPEFPVRDQNWGAGFSVTLPLGSSSANGNSNLDVLNNGASQSGSTRAQVGLLDDMGRERRLLESRVAGARAIDDHNRLKNEIAIEISRQCDALREAWETIRIGNGRVYFNYASFQILIQRYQVGEVRRDEIVEAEIELVRAQQELVDAIAAYMNAAYALEFAGALEPDELGLIETRRGRGNIILSNLLDENFEDLRNARPDPSDPRSLREILEQDVKPSSEDKEEYMIEKVESQ